MRKAIFKSASLLSLMTLLSRMLGFVRDQVAASLFGVNSAVDTFYIAFRIPNLLRNVFAEGAFSQAFIPVLSEYPPQHNPSAVRVFIRRLFAVWLCLLVIVTILGICGSPYLISLFAPGLDADRFQLATHMLRITFPYLLLISISAFMGAILNAHHQFGIPALTPALFNICLILAAVTLAQHLAVPMESQAWGVLIAGLVQILIQLPALYRLGFSLWPQRFRHDAGVRRVFKLLVPALLGASTGQISILMNTILASFLTMGSITWLYYSERLAYFPLGVFGVALTTVMLPRLSRQHATQSNAAFADLVNWGVRCHLLIGIPSAITLLLLSGPFIVSLFQYGHFTVTDVVMTQRSVMAYALGLPAFMLVKILSSIFYARQDTRTPVKLAMMALALGLISSVLLIVPLQHAGLALATSLSAWLNALLLWWTLYRRGLYRLRKQRGDFILRLVMANTVLALFLWCVRGNLGTWLHWNCLDRLVHLFMISAGAIAVYVLCFTNFLLDLTAQRALTIHYREKHNEK